MEVLLCVRGVRRVEAEPPEPSCPELGGGARCRARGSDAWVAVETPPTPRTGRPALVPPWRFSCLRPERVSRDRFWPEGSL